MSLLGGQLALISPTLFFRNNPPPFPRSLRLKALLQLEQGKAHPYVPVVRAHIVGKVAQLQSDDLLAAHRTVAFLPPEASTDQRSSEELLDQRLLVYPTAFGCPLSAGDDSRDEMSWGFRVASKVGVNEQGEAFCRLRWSLSPPIDIFGRCSGKGRGLCTEALPGL